MEEINLLFTSDSILVSENMAEYDRRVAEAGGNIAVAARKLLDEVDGHASRDPTRVLGGAEVEVGMGEKEKVVAVENVDKDSEGSISL